MRLIIADQRIPAEAKRRLQDFGELIPLLSDKVVYQSIAGHPDIFIFQLNQQLILSPQTPKNVINKLLADKIPFDWGSSLLSNLYPFTTAYNVAAADGLVIGNRKWAEPAILRLTENDQWLQTRQAYARCNNLILDHNHIITSDLSIAKMQVNSLLVDPKPIVLKGHAHGFIGGCFGIYQNLIFLLGNLNFHPQGKQIRNYCQELGYTIIELYKGPLLDAGGIFIIELS
jgi:hypothetical protein